jgi:hypothetical protein
MIRSQQLLCMRQSTSISTLATLGSACTDAMHTLLLCCLCMALQSTSSSTLLLLLQLLRRLPAYAVSADVASCWQHQPSASTTTTVAAAVCNHCGCRRRTILQTVPRQTVPRNAPSFTWRNFLHERLDPLVYEVSGSAELSSLLISVQSICCLAAAVVERAYIVPDFTEVRVKLDSTCVSIKSVSVLLQLVVQHS